MHIIQELCSLTFSLKLFLYQHYLELSQQWGNCCILQLLVWLGTSLKGIVLNPWAKAHCGPQRICYDSNNECHRQTCCPFDSFISVQWFSSSSPELLRPNEIQPIISLRFMLRLLYTDSMSVTSESWNSATWKMNVSLYTGFGWPRRMDVLHLDISWPIEFSNVNLTYVSGKANGFKRDIRSKKTCFFIISIKNKHLASFH